MNIVELLEAMVANWRGSGIMILSGDDLMSPSSNGANYDLTCETYARSLDGQYTLTP